MSGPAVNLQRDGFYTRLNTTDEITLSSDNPVNQSQFKANSDAIVYSEFGQAHADHVNQYAVATDNFRGYGVHMESPIIEMVPYRVQAVLAGNTNDVAGLIGVGYAPETITGTDDNIVNPSFFPFVVNADLLIQVPKAGSSYEGRPLCFAVLITDFTAQARTIFSQISVQNLSKAPPPFAQSVA